LSAKNEKQFISTRKIMFFIDGYYLTKNAKDIFKKDVIVYPTFIDILLKEFQNDYSMFYFELIRVYYYDAIPEENDSNYSYQKERIKNIQNANDFDIRLGKSIKIKKNKKNKFDYRQKGVDTLIAIDMLAKAYQNHYDIAILITGDEDIHEIVSAVKNTGKKVFGIYFDKHISSDLKNSFDRTIKLQQTHFI
jgi:uncharacterized LabA/DUF88 family protein